MQKEDSNKEVQVALHKEIIDLINRGFNTDELIVKLSLKRRALIKEYFKLLINSTQLLTTEEKQLILNEYAENCSFKNFAEGRIAIISDTHLASKNANLEYLKQAKDFLVENDIKYLLHGGDIGDGMVEYSKEYATYQKQLDHILNVYDFGNIKQYILGGNHDAKYKRKNADYDILNLLEETYSDIEAVGYYQSYFKIGNNVISFEHNSYCKKSFIGRDLSILGHSHYLRYNDSIIILPTLSDSFPNKNRAKDPGFVVLDSKLKDNHTSIEFTNYKTTDNGLVKGKIKTYTLR